MLSEVLPYELPFYFSYRGYYNIADRARLKIDAQGNIKNKSEIPHAAELQKTLIDMLNLCRTKHKSFRFGINKDGKENGRELVLVHPYIGLNLVFFYQRYAGFMLNCCRRSNYSLRYPHHIVKKIGVTSYKQTFQKLIPDSERVNIPKSYFFYFPYRNINHFYESYFFQRLEGRYKFLFQTDMKHCFDNIPAGRLSEAVYCTDKTLRVKKTFSEDACQLMKKMNGKRRGIAIGSEFSRIYAEIILQRIDSQIECRMSEEGFYQQKDYICLRYVDDIFLFYNDEMVRNLFDSFLKIVLRSWGIEINQKKEYGIPQNRTMFNIYLI